MVWVHRGTEVMSAWWERWSQSLPHKGKRLARGEKGLEQHFWEREMYMD